ncbi:hypothetical protein Cgig2_007191 [Carnegiea gigantea]|uniref:MADS-box domain-containing protein n=1 Tax=Carnegiea gigantea TaxID=171969 RepID=A0A9Q1GJ66_9CARY|nr:hypothetical protein Cgig2_007191 [Carnegiea gigantea]
MEGDLLGKKKTKRGRRRTKLPMELIRDSNKRCVAFSKRKKDLFAKCVALSSKFFDRVEVAAVLFSQCGRMFSFGHPSTDAVLRRYLGDGHLQTTTATTDGKAGPWWDNVSVDEMNMEELRQFKSSLEQLRSRALGKIIDLGFQGSEDTSTTDHDLVDFDDLVNLEELGFGNVVVDDQRQHCPCERFGDAGLMDIVYEAQRHIFMYSCSLLYHPSPYSQTPALEPDTQEVGASNSTENHCKATRYPNLCYNSLSIYASSIQTNPWLLADTALSVALSATQNTFSFIRKQSRSPQIRPRTVGPMEDCLDALVNIQTQFRAALANEDSCTDGFSEKAIVSKMKMAVTRKIKSIVQLTSNALAFINNYASDHVQGRTDHYRFETSGNVGNSLLQTIDNQHHLVARAQDDRFGGDML